MNPNAPRSPHSKEWEPAPGVQNPHTRTSERVERSPPKHKALSSLTPLEVQHPEQIPCIHALLLATNTLSHVPD
jgi:hypothetical protein